MVFVFYDVGTTPCGGTESTAAPSGAGIGQLNILALGPYRAGDAGWTGGPALIPAAQLAAKLINNNDSILKDYSLNIVPVDSGCDLINTVLLVNFIKEFFSPHERNSTATPERAATVGIVGPGCSEAALKLAPILIHDQLNLMQISIATTPEINTDAVYKNTFRAVSSALKFVDSYESLLEHTTWNRYAVLYDSARPYHTAMYEEFTDRFFNRSETLYQSGIEDFLLQGAFQSILDMRLRIIFVFAGQEAARRILCVASKMEMIFPAYQWLFTEKIVANFVQDTDVNLTVRVSCSKDEMEKAINGVILSEFLFRRVDDKERVVSNLSSNEYEMMYDDFYDQHLKDHKVNESSISEGAKSYAYPYFDATWALALALDSSLEELKKSNLSLTHDYRYGTTTAKTVGDVIQKNLRDISFEGVSGSIRFDRQTRSIAPSSGINVYQVNVTKNNVTTDLVCMYIDDACMDFDKSNITLVEDEFEHVITRPPFSLGIIILIIAGLSFIVVAILQFLYMYHSDKRSIKATSTNLNCLVFSGSYLYLVAVLTFTTRETFADSIHHSPVLYGVLCSMFIWCSTLAVTLIFGTICVKVWRIYRIFRYFRHGRVRFVSDGLLIGGVVVLLSVDFVYLLAWNLISPWRVHVENSTSYPHLMIHYLCTCDHLAFWSIPLGAYKGALVIVVIFLSILIRRIKRKEFDSSKYIIALIYLLFLLYAVLVPIYFIFLTTVPILSFLAQNFLALSTVYASCSFLFVPPLLLVWKKKTTHKKKTTIHFVTHHVTSCNQ